MGDSRDCFDEKAKAVASYDAVCKERDILKAEVELHKNLLTQNAEYEDQICYLKAEVERLKELIAVQNKELENSEVSHDEFSKEIQSLKDKIERLENGTS